jgi:hypothetical protein
MKKTATILFSLFYLLIISGVSVSIHYCQGEVKDIGILTAPANCCGIMGLEEGCCSNENYVVQFESKEQLKVSNKFSIEAFQFNIKELELSPTEIVVQDSKDEYNYYDLPPPENQKTIILNSTFIFYG